MTGPLSAISPFDNSTVSQMFTLAGKRVLLTGGSGFIGRQLRARLAQLGASVVAPSSRDPVDENLFGDGFDHVFHLAGKTGVVDSWQEPLAYFTANTLGTARLVEQCRKAGCSMTLASAYVYGLAKHLPISEAHPVEPNNPYAVSKRLAEQICAFYAQSFGVNVVILRLFNIYGPHQSTNFLIPWIVSQVIDPNALEVIVQDLSPRRDYLFITDAVEAIVASIATRSCAIFNVGSGVSYSVEEIIQAAEAAAGVNKPYRAVGTRRACEIDDVVADISAIEKELGWRPSIPIEQGLREVVASMANAAD